MAPVLIGSTLGREAAEKVKELKLGERVLSFKWYFRLCSDEPGSIIFNFYYLGIICPGSTI